MEVEAEKTPVGSRDVENIGDGVLRRNGTDPDSENRRFAKLCISDNSHTTEVLPWNRKSDARSSPGIRVEGPDPNDNDSDESKTSNVARSNYRIRRNKTIPPT